MDNPKISEDTREKIEEAAVSVFMDQYAAALDASIDIKMEECKDMEFPPELDKRCRALIQREYAKEHNKKRGKNTLRVFRSAAIVAVALLSLCSVLFVSVEAFRLPIMNFFIEKTERYWQLSGAPNADTIQEAFNPENPLDGIIPDDFILTNQTGTWEDGYLTADYSNGEQAVINFSVSLTADNIQIDTEESMAMPYKVHGHDALKSIKDNFVRVSWKDEKNAKIFTLCAINVSAEMVEHYAEAIAMLLD